MVCGKVIFWQFCDTAISVSANCWKVGVIPWGLYSELYPEVRLLQPICWEIYWKGSPVTTPPIIALFQTWITSFQIDEWNQVFSRLDLFLLKLTRPCLSNQKNGIMITMNIYVRQCSLEPKILHFLRRMVVTDLFAIYQTNIDNWFNLEYIYFKL